LLWRHYLSPPVPKTPFIARARSRCRSQVDRSGALSGHFWYEQARLPNSFEEGCQRATAEYALRDDGLISVVNTCFEAEWRTARGAWTCAANDGEAW
jgi:lipocalin